MTLNTLEKTFLPCSVDRGSGTCSVSTSAQGGTQPKRPPFGPHSLPCGFSMHGERSDLVQNAFARGLRIISIPGNIFRTAWQSYTILGDFPDVNCVQFNFLGLELLELLQVGNLMCSSKCCHWSGKPQLWSSHIGLEEHHHGSTYIFVVVVDVWSVLGSAGAFFLPVFCDFQYKMMMGSFWLIQDGATSAFFFFSFFLVLFAALPCFETNWELLRVLRLLLQVEVWKFV